MGAPRASLRVQSPQVPSVQIDYYTAQDTGAPYSFVHTRTSEDRCDPTQMQEAFAYVDGLGRSRLAVTEGDQPATAPGHTEWIASDYKEFDGKGAVARTLTSGFISWAPAPGPHTPPQPLQEQNCTDDESIGPTSVCATHIAYDAFGRKALITLADGTTTKTTYHGPLVTKAWDGNDTNPSSPYANTPSTTEKDGHGRVIKKSFINVPMLNGNPQAHETIEHTFSYSPLGDLTEMVQDSGGINVIKTQIFDSIGQRRVLMDPAAGTWEMEFDDAGNLIRSVDANGNDIRYGYDAANRLLWEDCVACPISQTCQQGGDPEVRYFYDSPYRMVGGRGYMPEEVSAYNGGDYNYAEVPQDYVLGRLSWMEDETGKAFVSYDRNGKTLVEAQQVKATYLGEVGATVGSDSYYISRTFYDDQGRVIKEVYPDDNHLTVVTEYDNRGDVSLIRGPEADPISPDYTVYLSEVVHDAGGSRTHYCLGDEAETCTDISYDRLGRRKHRVTEQSQGYGYELMNRRFYYDGASNIKDILDERPYGQVAGAGGYAEENPPHHLHMVYDGLYRLVETVYEDTDSSNTLRKMSYGYDALGNILFRETQDASGLSNPSHEFYEKWFSTATFDPAHPHRLLAVGGDTAQSATLLYDAAGNVTELRVVNGATGRDTTFSYEWDHYHRLVKARRQESGGGDEVVAEHRYDAGNSRVLKGVSSLSAGLKTAVYVSQGFELRDEQDVKYVFSDTARIVKIDGSGWWTFANDHLHTTSLMASWSGEVASTTTHLPFGAIEVETGAVDEPYKFTGKELERGFGIYYFGARYYNPQLGRWLSVDPLELGLVEKPRLLVSYQYCHNDPYEYRDPDGNWPIAQEISKLTKTIYQKAKKAASQVQQKAKVAYQKTKKWTSDHMLQTPVDAAHKEIKKPQKQRKTELSKAKKGIKKRAESAKGTAKLAKVFGYTSVAAGIAVGISMVAIYGPGAAAAAKDVMIDGAAWLAARYPRLAKVLIGTPGAAVGAKKAARGASSKILGNSAKQLQKKFKHAKDFGVTGNYSKANATEFSSAINQHINSPGVRTIQGTYHKQPVTHFLDPSTGLNVISDPAGNFISGWRLSPGQLQNVLKHGGL